MLKGESPQASPVVAAPLPEDNSPLFCFFEAYDAVRLLKPGEEAVYRLVQPLDDSQRDEMSKYVEIKLDYHGKNLKIHVTRNAVPFEG